jgi:hypothetical protein
LQHLATLVHLSIYMFRAHDNHAWTSRQSSAIQTRQSYKRSQAFAHVTWPTPCGKMSWRWYTWKNTTTWYFVRIHTIKTTTCTTFRVLERD